MSSSFHTISDSDSDELDDRPVKPYTIPKLSSSNVSAIHELSESDDDRQIGMSATKRKRSPSSDRTIDPSDDGDLFQELADRKRQCVIDVSDSDSDVTLDLSPSVCSKSLAKSASPSKKKSVSPVKKIRSLDHQLSDSDSDSGKPEAKASSSKMSKQRPNSHSPDKKKSHTTSSEKNQNISKSKKVSPNPKSKSPSSAKSPKGPTVSHRPMEKSVKKRRISVSESDDDSDVTVDAQTPGSSKSPAKPEDKTGDKRPVCIYGSNCYRKNPSHHKQLQHPDGGGLSIPLSSPSPAARRSFMDSALDKATTSTDPAPVPTPGGVPDTPLGFLLTTVQGIPAQYNTLAVGIKDLLSPAMGKLVKSAQFNYMTDIPWLVSQYPLEFRKCPLLIVHGFQRREKAGLAQEASVYEQITLCQARLDIPYGTHHTKMMLLVYDDGMRVVIHTANLIHGDWHQKTQGVWLSPLFPRLPPGAPPEAGDSPTHFQRDLLQYLAGYQSRQLDEWTDTIRQHDMGMAKVFLIGSIPGRHTGEKKHAYGHLKLRKLLHQSGPTPLHVASWPVIGQFSSIGSLGAGAEGWVCSEWLASLSAARGGEAGPARQGGRPKLIFPTKDNVRTSLEGYPAGTSLPYSISTAKKQPWLHTLFHQWRSDYRGRSRASPHIKTYLRVSPDYRNIAWFAVTSANLSKAAWGVLEKSGHQLMIRSYELGVLFLPEQFGGARSFQPMSDISQPLVAETDRPLVFPVPYDLPLTEYSKTDRPWVWDIPYVDKPDTNGNKWCPR